MPRTASAVVLAFVPVAIVLTSCGSGPSKSDALDTISHGVKEDASCTLPVDVLAQVKVQYASKGLCIPKEGAAAAKTCIDALVAAGVTHSMSASYMVEWPDDVAAKSLAELPATSRPSRNLVYQSCVELSGNLREGRFTCAEAVADKVIKVEASSETRATVRYARIVTPRPWLDAVEKACRGLTRPPAEATATLVKRADKKWGLADESDTATGPR